MCGNEGLKANLCLYNMIGCKRRFGRYGTKTEILHFRTQPTQAILDVCNFVVHTREPCRTIDETLFNCRSIHETAAYGTHEDALTYRTRVRAGTAIRRLNQYPRWDSNPHALSSSGF